VKRVRIALLALLGLALALLVLRGWNTRTPAPPGAGPPAGSAPPSAESAAPASAAAGTGPAAPQRVVSPSGIALHLVRRPALTVPDHPYSAAYQQLEPAARSGDPAAQYRLGLLLYECRDVPVDEATLGREIETVYQTRRRNGWDVDDPADEARTLRRRYQECAGVPGEARGQYRDWLRRAADAGLVEAQLGLPLHLPPGEYCQYWSECTPQQRVRQEALQQEAIDYLGKARDAGSAAALWTFGAWYAEGEVLPRNDVEAYAHFRALDEINAASGDPHRFSAMLDDLRGRLRPADLDQAEARARELLSGPNCCVLTP
jgi:TPR repeat protein